MKLLKSSGEMSLKKFDELEYLQLDNELLRDEIDLQSQMQSLELMETVLSCIEKEGTVSKSIEVMFGEGEDISTFQAGLQKAYDSALEAFISDVFNKKLEWRKLENLVDSLIAKSKEVITFIETNKSKISFPLKVNLAWKYDDFKRAAQKLHSICNLLVQRKWNKEYKDVRINEFKDLLNEVEAYSKERSKETPAENIEELSLAQASGDIGRDIKEHYKPMIRDLKAFMSAFDKHVSWSGAPKDERKVTIAKFNKVLFFELRSELHHMFILLNRIYAAAKAQMHE